jgi:hypothetical protein
MRRSLIVIALLFLFSLPVIATDVNLAWDASTSADVQGYALFNKDYQKAYNYDDPIWQGSVLNVMISVASDRQTAFVARAWKWGPYDLQGNRMKVWSLDSNEVIFTPAVTKPEPPKNLLHRIIAAVLGFFAPSSV